MLTFGKKRKIDDNFGLLQDPPKFGLFASVSEGTVIRKEQELSCGPFLRKGEVSAYGGSYRLPEIDCDNQRHSKVDSTKSKTLTGKTSLHGLIRRSRPRR